MARRKRRKDLHDDGGGDERDLADNKRALTTMAWGGRGESMREGWSMTKHSGGKKAVRATRLSGVASSEACVLASSAIRGFVSVAAYHLQPGVRCLLSLGSVAAYCYRWTDLYGSFHAIFRIRGSPSCNALSLVGTCRYDSSLGLLTKRFINLLKQAQDDTLDLNKAAQTLEKFSLDALIGLDDAMPREVENDMPMLQIEVENLVSQER
ncbi:hypothetical protein ZIOFF_027967 [Zingiber officinale]|uniref:E2F/DP family winged-helix DNA-binding domain-containing protein n=1 Tax=Zingiber officinale TaxID=94328 RepID=A0A8J5GZ63_ZINOF|nr:hypothetical protein ZIOFF_027967 [Zingiber officinale]